MAMNKAHELMKEINKVLEKLNKNSNNVKKFKVFLNGISDAIDLSP